MPEEGSVVIHTLPVTIVMSSSSMHALYFFFRQVAAWNHTAESTEDICGFLPPRCELALAGTDPHERLVKVAYDSLHIVLTVVLVKNEACGADCFFFSFSAVFLLPFNSLI